MFLKYFLKLNFIYCFYYCILFLFKVKVYDFFIKVDLLRLDNISERGIIYIGGIKIIFVEIKIIGNLFWYVIL